MTRQDIGWISIYDRNNHIDIYIEIYIHIYSCYTKLFITIEHLTTHTIRLSMLVT
jgi:hypothetical protein